MKKTFLQILSYSLIAIFLYNTAGFYSNFLIQNIVIKTEIESKINSKNYDYDLIQIKINKQNLNKIIWHKKNKEFEFNNKLYDVVKMQKNKNQIIFYCIEDSKEKELFESFKNHFFANYNNNSSKKHTNNILLKNFLKNLFFENYGLQNHVFSQKISYHYFVDNTRLGHISKTEKPPKFWL